ncbi:hypothetical protein BKA67DRAFT_544447 [Truncatella angustata]|uniref:Uncharacterized protein n=1 Tax=Truncatella angustata TaxID=152316 RepID=A0A9P9A1E9_9PEZI|nr:uncharacterized protein BKA67DRAFT_544447 [Truncatella angustata]KAH6659446.1 hypothetical protein BKA67DRAFT_544447 [Truncatella angustata]KAH8205550.1 hypothetical protein TruAng_000256 [Truncatella angustata]
MLETSATAVLASYEERDLKFNIDDSNKELGQRNTDDSDYNRVKITQRDLGDLSVISSLQRVQYGLWKEEPACLINFRFQFQKGNSHLFRFENVRILVEFTARPPGTADQDPEVFEYGPKYLTAAETSEERSWHLNASFSSKAKVGAFESGPEVESGKAGTYTRNYAAKIESDDYGNRKHKKPNCVKTWLAENEKQKGGVPTELYTAIVVGHRGRPAQVTISIRADYVFNMLAMPWTKDDPLLLEHGVAFGNTIGDGSPLDFATLSVEQWQELVTPDLQPRYAYRFGPQMLC